jgi:hypothetical protein
LQVSARGSQRRYVGEIYTLYVVLEVPILSSLAYYGSLALPRALLTIVCTANTVFSKCGSPSGNAGQMRRPSSGVKTVLAVSVEVSTPY